MKDRRKIRKQNLKEWHQEIITKWLCLYWILTDDEVSGSENKLFTYITILTLVPHPPVPHRATDESPMYPLHTGVRTTGGRLWKSESQSLHRAAVPAVPLPPGERERPSLSKVNTVSQGRQRSLVLLSLESKQMAPGEMFPNLPENLYI